MDPTGDRVLGFFCAKRLLLSNVPPHWDGQPLTVSDVIKVGREIEPRVLAVLPAAIILYPESFRGEMPADLAAVLDHIKRGVLHGPEFGGVKYEEMKRWADAGKRR